jgi:signal peptidase I
MGKTKPRKKRAFLDRRYVRNESRKAYQWACILFWTILLFFFFQRYVIGVGIVIDRSMLPTLREGDVYLINKYITHLVRPERGDIVVLRRNRTDTDPYVKRIVALEGDTLLIVDGNVFVNGQRSHEPYAVGGTFPDLGPKTIEKGFCFVMGDNRVDSEDSRRFGNIPLKNIEGKIQPGEWFPFR